jgi:hypothetical protein
MNIDTFFDHLNSLYSNEFKRSDNFTHIKDMQEQIKKA